MKKLGIVTNIDNVGYEYKRMLGDIFNGKIDIKHYSFEKNDVGGISSRDMLVFSTYTQYEMVKDIIGENTSVIIPKFTLSKKGYNILKNSDIPNAAMLVNEDLEMSIESISLLYQLGFGDYELSPVYPGMENIPDCKAAIVFSTSALVPAGVDIILDLGHRVFDKSTIVNIALALDLEDILSEKQILEYFDSIVINYLGAEPLISRTKTLKTQFNTLLSIMEKGVVGVSEKCVIENINDKAVKLINRDIKYIGSDVEKVLPELGLKEFFRNKRAILNKLIKIDGNIITMSVVPVSEKSLSSILEIDHGAYVILESFESQEDTQNKLRLELTNKGHVAKYDIDDIIGKSQHVEETKKLITQMKNSKSVVLITGESGTGKELIANAIHNVSQRRMKQFVAINCAALSPSILESELFGYEGGAFTGASKNGKAGIFELAHGGTLFLDEIGEMSLELQVKLLRVIQEKEVIRVGGSKVIKVDVRLIAATNRNLLEQMDKGLFRKDLYFRLNVFQINISSLKERREDIMMLFEYFVRQYSYNFEINDEVKSFLENYLWPGNIRELKNCVEYFGNLGDEYITMNYIPFHMKEYAKGKYLRNEAKIIPNMSLYETFVLKLFYEFFKKKKKLGRRSVSKEAYDRNIQLSEYDVKKILDSLGNAGYIEIRTGRGGSVITEKGIKLLEEK